MSKGLRIGITGLPASGKTMTLLKIIEMMEGEELIVGGMVTEPIIFRGRQVGFYIVDWATKKKRKFAHENIESDVAVGRYNIDTRALKTMGVGAIKNACENCDVVVIDEVGKMEVECEEFVEAVTDALDMETNKPVLLTLHKKSRNPLLQEIRRRDDVRVLEVTPVNRNILPYKVLKLLKGELL